MVEDKKNRQQLILKKWQKILRLSDWDIVLKMCRHYDLSENENGRIFISGSRKEALIKCVIQEDRDKYDFLHNEESTIIHELLHLHFYNIRGEESTTEEEQACHCLTKAFYELGAEREIEDVGGCQHFNTIMITVMDPAYRHYCCADCGLKWKERSSG